MVLPNKDEFQGGATRVGGEIKEKVGRFFENEELENEGKADQVKGTVQENFGKLKHDAKDAFNQTVAGISDGNKESRR